jgi:hypothetical protein
MNFTLGSDAIAACYKIDYQSLLAVLMLMLNLP